MLLRDISILRRKVKTIRCSRRVAETDRGASVPQSCQRSLVELVVHNELLDVIDLKDRAPIKGFEPGFRHSRYRRLRYS